MEPVDYVDILVKKYPKLLTDVPCSVDFPDGWFPLLDRLCNHIMYLHNLKNKRLPKVAQVKSKFAGLRFYIDNRVCKEIVAAIEFAELLSHTICEVCGNSFARKVVTNHWISTECFTCRPDEKSNLTDKLVASIDPAGSKKQYVQYLEEEFNENIKGE